MTISACTGTEVGECANCGANMTDWKLKDSDGYPLFWEIVNDRYQHVQWQCNPCHIDPYRKTY